MNIADAHKLLRLITRAGNQRAAAAELGCSQWAVSTRMSKARALLGDDAVLTLLNEYGAEFNTGKTRVKLDNKRSSHCHICGAEKISVLATGKLVCRPCANRNNQAYRNRVPDQVKASGAEYYATNRDYIRVKQRAYYAENRVSILAGHAARRAANPEYVRAYYRANAEQIKARTAAYAKANIAQIAARCHYRWLTDESFRQAARARLRAWKKLHPDRVNADTARRQLRLYQAYVSWADDELIQEFYALARLRTQLTGIAWQVDHIVPLNSDMVCGLHCEANLQVIPATTNLAKSNDWWPGMFSAPAPSLAAFFELPSLYLVAPARACLPAPGPASANEPHMEAAQSWA